MQQTPNVDNQTYAYDFVWIHTKEEAKKYQRFYRNPLKTDKQTIIKEYRGNEKMEIENQTQEFERVEATQLSIAKISLKDDKTHKYLMQVIFDVITPQKMKLTYKPYERKETKSMVGGFETVSSDNYSPLLSEIPQKLKDMNKKLNDKGELKIQASYTKMSVTDDRGSNTYYFMQNKDFAESKILN